MTKVKKSVKVALDIENGTVLMIGSIADRDSLINSKCMVSIMHGEAIVKNCPAIFFTKFNSELCAIMRNPLAFIMGAKVVEPTWEYEMVDEWYYNGYRSKRVTRTDAIKDIVRQAASRMDTYMLKCVEDIDPQRNQTSGKTEFCSRWFGQSDKPQTELCVCEDVPAPRKVKKYVSF